MEKEPKLEKTTKATPKAPSKTEKESQKRKLENEPESKIGTWQIVKNDK